MIVQSLINLQKDHSKKAKIHKKALQVQAKLKIIRAQIKHNLKAYRMKPRERKKQLPKEK
jgi:hypothetical protein